VDRKFPGQFQALTSGINLEKWDEELNKSGHGNVLLQALGAEKEIIPFITRHPTAKGDVFLFCSDGLRALPGQRIKEVMFSGITQGQSAKQIADQLLITALAGGRADDNVTLVIGRA
jgi:serine/threonine protein phosphatase PrpC